MQQSNFCNADTFHRTRGSPGSAAGVAAAKVGGCGGRRSHSGNGWLAGLYGPCVHAGAGGNGLECVSASFTFPRHAGSRRLVGVSISGSCGTSTLPSLAACSVAAVSIAARLLSRRRRRGALTGVGAAGKSMALTTGARTLAMYLSEDWLRPPCSTARGLRPTRQSVALSDKSVHLSTCRRAHLPPSRLRCPLAAM